MPATTAQPQTTRQRNDRIREWAEANVPTYYPANYRAEQAALHCPEASGLSPITVGNVLRGRDLQPRNRSARRSALRGATRALGFTRRFGVEIEFCGGPVTRGQIQAAISNGDLPRRWRVKSDMSVTGRGFGGEMVSPPLRGEDGIDEVRQVCRWLREHGATVNASCGLHVHHEAADLGAEGIVRVAEIYTAHQSLVNWLVSDSRRGGPRSSNYALQMSESRMAQIRRMSTSSRAQGPTRYLAVNVDAYMRHGTVEIRQHQGTLNAQKIEAWIRLGQGFCDAAAERTRVNESGLRGLLRKLEVDEDSAAFLLGRAVQFEAPVSVVS